MNILTADRTITKRSSTLFGRHASPRVRAQQIIMDFVSAWLASLLAFAAVGAASAAGLGYALTVSLLLAAAFTAGVAAFGAYRGRPWTVDSNEVGILFGGTVAGGILFAVVAALAGAHFRVAPLGIVVALICSAFLSIAQRVAVEALARNRRRNSPSSEATIIVGAGNAAQTLIHVIEENERFPFKVVGCVDDDFIEKRVGKTPLLGKVSDLPVLIGRHNVATVIVAIPSAPRALIDRVGAICHKHSASNGKPVVIKVLPGVSDLLAGRIRYSRSEDIKLEDLLRRDLVRVDLSLVEPHLENRIVLVTGAGGSIGSELCRQIVAFRPKLLLLLGHGENSLFAIHQELSAKMGFTRTRIVLADVADAARIRTVFSQYRPHIVFHAAAHKHVPIVEDNVCEAVRNNVFGTHVVALAAAAAGVAKFVLLSTDKAVNPTSIMGVTKRISEHICQSFARRTGTEFVSVRFGNVLGSRGSVLPIFKEQIDCGGPVTVTHKDMKRYFMTIPEAVSLVLQAMSIGRDGQVFVLDMGEPVNILQLAETMVSLCGLTPYRDIDIVVTGIRPGEKLFEEILTTKEGMSRTSHERLFIAQQERMEYDVVAGYLSQLERASRFDDLDTILHVLGRLVPSYEPGAHLRGAKPQDVFEAKVATNGSPFVVGASALSHDGAGSTNGETLPGTVVPETESLGETASTNGEATRSTASTSN